MENVFAIDDIVKIKPWKELSKNMKPLGNSYYDAENDFVIDCSDYMEVVNKVHPIQGINLNDNCYILGTNNFWIPGDWLELV